VNIKERGAEFHRFDVNWTPAVLIMDSKGTERYRIEGYLPRDEFRAHLEMGLGRVAFKAKKWEEAERNYSRVSEEMPGSTCVSEALYWRAVCRYQSTHDPSPLVAVASELASRFPDSLWAKKAIPWRQEEAERKVA
jgi:hypothetical protein